MHPFTVDSMHSGLTEDHLGNIGPPSPSLKPENGPPSSAVGAADFDTPTLKTAKYTTGRGGIGNMAKNDPEHPELAREAQDVNPPLSAQMKKVGQFHTGIGMTRIRGQIGS